MESYIEFSFLQQIMTMELALRLAQSFCLQPISNKTRHFYSFSMAFLTVILWNSYAWLIIIIVEITFLLISFRHAYKTYAMAFVLRSLLMLSGWVIFDGSFHNGIWFVPMDIRIGYWWLLYIFVYISHEVKWKDISARHSYVYDITLYSSTHFLVLKGYFDSGNLLSFEDKPVIFVDRRYAAYFQDESIHWVVMKGIAQEKLLKCYSCELAFTGNSRHKVLVHCENTLHLPFQCMALLNVNLMTMG